jgi:hypothetical protein
MQILRTDEVDNFIESSTTLVQKHVDDSICLLEQYGHFLRMPHAKPVGGGLWELRIRTRPAIRILYGFCHRTPILLVAFKKQQSAIPRNLFDKARRLFGTMCNY